MSRVRRCVRPLFVSTLSIVLVACGSSTENPGRPDAGESRDASEPPDTTDASMRSHGSGGSPGSGGTLVGPGSAGTPGALGGFPSGGVAVGGTMGAGCAVGSDAATDLPSDSPGAGPELVSDVVDASAKDASVRDAGARDAGTNADGSTTPVTYPPLQFAKIGRSTVVASTFFFTEGPVWDPKKQVLFFSDINADSVYRLTLPNTLDVVIDHIGNTDGLALDADGDLIGAGFASRDVWRFDGTNVRSLVGDYRTHKLNSPDDLTTRSDGTIYFTDPTFGINGSQGFAAQAAELCFQGVYRLTSDALILEDMSTAGPNGVNFSPDESTLYVSYTGSGQVFAFSVARDGSLHDKTLFANVLLADSMCVDAAGDVYVASALGVTVLDPSGKQLGVISTSGQTATNCTFGGPDQRTFFMTVHSALALVPSKGTSSLLRIDAMPIPGIPGRN
jgi:gluconolactonase